VVLPARHFTMSSTLIPPPGGSNPDNFSMVLFSGYDPVNGYDPGTGTGGTPIPTADPLGSNTFFNFDINGPGSTTVSTFNSVSGDVTIIVTPASVPEPASAITMFLGLIGVLTAIRRRQRQPGFSPRSP
jgi:hypothetical protein